MPDRIPPGNQSGSQPGHPNVFRRIRYARDVSSGSALRALVGVIALAAAAAIPVVGILTTRSARPIPSEPSRELQTLLEERGVRYFDGTPAEKAGALRDVVIAGSATDVNDLVLERGAIKTPEGIPYSGYVVEYWPETGTPAPETPDENGTGAAGTPDLSGTTGTGAGTGASRTRAEPRVVYATFDGAPVGPAVSFYPDGTIERSVNYLDGQLVGQIIEYYPDATLRLRAVSAGRSVNGGTEVAELSVGRHAPTGYERDELGTGRLQFIGPGGSTRGENEDYTPGEFTAFMLFDHGWFGRQTRVTPDSRELPGPAIDAE